MTPHPRTPLLTRALPDSAWILGHVRYLADPRLEGRGVGTEGIEIAADYLEREFRALGLLPAGDEELYRQSVEVISGVRVEAPTDLEIAGRHYAEGRDFRPFGFSVNGDRAAPVVFAGYGITGPELGYDDYRGLDVEGRYVLVLRYEPDFFHGGERDGRAFTAHAEFRTKAINARERGAAGLLVVTGPGDERGRERLVPPQAGGYMASGILAAHVRRAVAGRLLEGSGWTLEGLQDFIEVHRWPKSLALESRARLRVRLLRSRAWVDNVIGVLPGTDPSRTIVIGAHYDHLGFGGGRSRAGAGTESLHPGADDNASGTAALLALARAWTSRAEPPRHNLVFAAFAAEELGLLGSERYARAPPFPIEGTEAMLNLDMVGRLGEGPLVVMGSGTAAGLDELVREEAERAGLEIRLVPEGFGPSDHTSFYKRGVPVLSLFSGIHGDYHRPSDTWEKLDLGGLTRIARLAFAISSRLDASPALAFQEAPGTTAFRSLGAGRGAYLGSIPDYARTEGGVRLTGVRADGPADRAGIRAGDVIVAFGEVEIDNIHDLTFALRSHEPGDEVEIALERDGARLTVRATLGSRE